MRRAAFLLAVAFVLSGLLTARPASADDVEQRIAGFWKRVDAMGPSDLLAAADLGQWALNVIDRDAGAGIRVDDFRTSTVAMQDAFDRAGVGIPPGTPKSPDVEARIARFWQRVDALRPADLLTATDLGQWALNVTDRDPNKRIRVDDFRTSTAGMQGGFDRAKSLPRPATPAPTPRPSPTPTPTASATVGPSPTGAVASPSATATPRPSATATPATTITTGGFTFTVKGTATADVYVEQTISTADAQTIATTADADVADVQTSYGRSFATRPAIYAFPSTTTYTTGIQSVLGVPANKAVVVGAESAGIVYTTTTSGGRTTKVAINWAQTKVAQPNAVIRHELTHVMIEQIAKPVGDSLPAWINEGRARLEEFTIANTSWYQNDHRYYAGSMVAVRNYFTLPELTSQEVWSLRTGNPGIFQYHEASQIVALLRQDVGAAGVTRIFEFVGQGQTFDMAFQTVTGKSVTSFGSSVIGRLQNLSQFYPYIATASDEPGRSSGLSYVLYGFQPGSSINLDIRGINTGVFNTTKTQTADAYGVFNSYLGPLWPPDTYMLTATGPAPASSKTPGASVSVQVTVVKAASLDALSATWQ